MKRKISTRIGIVSAVVIMMGAMSPVMQTLAKVNNSITIALSNDVTGFDPQKTASASTFEVTNNIYDTLVEINAKGQLIPGLATSWSSSNGGKVWTFKLRKGVLFQNGKLFTAKDVKYTYSRILNAATADPNISDFKSISKVQVDSTYQVTFVLTSTYAPFLSTLALPWAAIIENGTGSHLNSKPIGTGPYELVSWVPQQSIVLKRFNKAWDAKQALIQNVKFDIIPDASTQLLDLESGSVDVTTVAPSSAQVVKHNQNLHLLSGPANDVQIMAMNNASAPLNNVLVRRAINYAINKNDIIQAVDFGYGQIIGSHMSPVSPYYVNLQNRYSYNPTKAKALLKQAGYPNGLTLNMALPQPYAIHVQTGQIIAQQLLQVGIKVNISIIPWTEWLQNVYLGRQFQLTVIDHTGRLDPAQLLNRYQTGNSGNYFNFSDPMVNKDLTLADTELNPGKRKALYAQVQKLLANDAANVFIQAPDYLIGMNKSVKGWVEYPIDIYNLRGVSIHN